MSSLADDFRELADDIRSIPGNDFELYEYRCYLVRKTWTGENPGDGDQVTELVPLTCGNGSNPKVRFANQRDIALGNMSLGEVAIGPVTPAYGTGGVDRRWFDGYGIEPGTTQIIRIVAPNSDDSSDYKVNYTNMDRALRVVIRATNLMISGE